MTEAQVMEQLSKLHACSFFLKKKNGLMCCFLERVVTAGNPNDLYKKTKRVGQG